MNTKDKKPMNCKEANEIRIIKFLFERGVNLERNTGGDFWYCSPLRREEKASFKVSSAKNVWYDYGTGTGGKLIDLVCAMYRVDVPGALSILSGTNFSAESVKFDLSFDKQMDSPVAGIKIKKIQNLQNAALIQYIEQRKIPFHIASPFVKEVYYTAKNKTFFSLAFENDLGGYELRNKFWQGSNNPKGVTTIPGVKIKTVNIFEGFMDFLSALVYYGIFKPNCNTIVLNGVGQIGKVYNQLSDYDHINLYLDNDKAGKDTSKIIQDKYPEAVNRSESIYPGSKDFNEFLVLK